jgi:hypothetical protein
MIVSEPARYVLHSTAQRWLRRLLARPAGEPAWDEGEADALLPGSLSLFDAGGRIMVPATALPEPIAEPVAAEVGAPIEAPPTPLSAEERRARAAAVRGLMQARDGRFDQARERFAEAAQLDPSLDLASVPTFWSLPRGAQQAAVEALHIAGREEDAALLAAEISYTFRPKLVRRRPAPIGARG